MKAALKTADGRFEIAEVDDPVLPAPDWVKARVRVAGICGTDLRHWEKPDEHLHCCIMGHELAGQVVEIGEAVTRVRPGDRVVIESVLGCGHCEWCRARQYNLCPDLYPTRRASVSRAYAEFVIGPEHKFYTLPDHVSFEEAALVDTFSVALHAPHLSGLTINDKVAIIGAGPIGLGQLMLAKRSGADVLIIDTVASSLAVARGLGVDATVDSSRQDAVAAALAFTGERGVDVVFECAGGLSMPKTLPLATSLARRGARWSSWAASTRARPPSRWNGRGSRCPRYSSSPAPASPITASAPSRARLSSSWRAVSSTRGALSPGPSSSVASTKLSSTPRTRKVPEPSSSV